MAKRSVFGIYNNRLNAESAVDELRLAGFRAADISVLLPENRGNKEMAVESNSKAPEGATAGGASGAVVGGALGWLAGIGALAIPGVGPLIAAGPIVGALAGLGAGGATGALVGSLIGYGIPEYEAKRYEGRVKNGGILFSVHVDDSEWRDKAEEILERTGADDVHATSESSADHDVTEKPVARGSAR
jgi:hypothetical protein